MEVTAGKAMLSSFHPGSDAASSPRERIRSLDIIRGIVMVLMAIDHVRVYAGVPAGGPNPGVFFTRWVTNFSAPVFAFLAGTGAYFYAKKAAAKGDVSKFLATRGVLLVLIELVYMRLVWTFNVDIANYNLAGVLWMLGWSMIALSLLSRLPMRAIAVIGALLVFGQAVFSPISNALPQALGAIIYQGGQAHIGALPLDVLYVLVPWIGVMALGFAFGEIMTATPERRNALCLRIGIAATVLWIAIGTALALSQARGDGPPLLFRVLGQRKYPASVPFLFMTLGPAIAFIPYAEKIRGMPGRMMETFGRVPLFFYLLHIPLIHLLAMAVSVIREGRVDPWLFGNHPAEAPALPPGYRWSLLLLYAVFAVAIAVLYPLCRWYARRKSNRPAPWMKYI